MMDMHMDMFSRSMDYKPTCDEHNGEMIRLSLLNQNLMVYAIDQLADVVDIRVPQCPHVGAALAPSSTTTTYEGEAEANGNEVL